MKILIIRRLYKSHLVHLFRTTFSASPAWFTFTLDSRTEPMIAIKEKSFHLTIRHHKYRYVVENRKGAESGLFVILVFVGCLYLNGWNAHPQVVDIQHTCFHTWCTQSEAFYPCQPEGHLVSHSLDISEQRISSTKVGSDLKLLWYRLDILLLFIWIFTSTEVFSSSWSTAARTWASLQQFWPGQLVVSLSFEIQCIRSF